jgi:hypothetical protein
MNFTANTLTNLGLLNHVFPLVVFLFTLDKIVEFSSLSYFSHRILPFPLSFHALH